MVAIRLTESMKPTSFFTTAVSILAIHLLTSCGPLRFQQTVGADKLGALQRLGPPKQTISLNDGGEVWVYPLGRETVSSSGHDRYERTNNQPMGEQMAGAFSDGVAEGISNSIVESLFVHRGPYRYVFIDRNGIVTGWETHTSFQ